jgi:hypothetical protein
MVARGLPIILRRAAVYVAVAVGLLGALIALMGVLVAALLGHGPSPATGLAIVALVAVAAGLAARLLIARIPWTGVLAFIAGRIAARRAGRRGR